MTASELSAPEFVPGDKPLRHHSSTMPSLSSFNSDNFILGLHARALLPGLPIKLNRGGHASL